ncbi:hypothetical protein BJ165DRAFT_266778 [Panaeolus papilionaceus]|nr:hypothetical protein BJ165DRAFT_266778 [Panaeolus papilionaceus]
MPYKLEITGEVSVERCESVANSFWYCILILGPTGAGKSSFIESLAGEGQSLGISKDQLAGFTQEVTAYELQNATVQEDEYTCTLYLIDAPGFSDSKISELEIITKVKQWMVDQGVGHINGVLYLSPITDTRAPGSKRRTIKMIQLLLHDDSFQYLNIVTTMWDRLSNPQAKKRAETHFAQLQDDIWKGPISKGAQISRFHNDFDSAIQILQSIIDIKHYLWGPLEKDPINSKDASAPFLYQELLDRIANAQQEKEYLRQEKMCLITNPDPRLELVVLSRLPEVKNDLAKFLGQLVAFGTPPPGFEGAPEQCVYQDLLDQVNEARAEQAALRVALAHLHTNPDLVRETALIRQLYLVEQDLEQHVTTLRERGTPPEGCEEALEHALGPPIIPEEALPLWSPPSSCDPVPIRPNHTAALEIAPTVPIPAHITARTATHPENEVTVQAAVEPRPSLIVPDTVSTTAIPGRGDMTIRHPASATPEVSISSRAPLKDRFNKGVQSLKDKFTSRSRREGRR